MWDKVGFFDMHHPHGPRRAEPERVPTFRGFLSEGRQGLVKQTLGVRGKMGSSVVYGTVSFFSKSGSWTLSCTF